MKNIVVVDDEQYICNVIKEALGEFSDFKINIFTDPATAFGFIEDNKIDLVLTDLVMGNRSGVQILETTLANHPDAVVILMTGYPTVKTAISVLKKGGYDYLIKPFKLTDLKATISRGLEHQKVIRENVELRSQLELMRVTEAANRGMRLQPLLKLIVDSTRNVLPAVGVSILLLDRTTGGFKLQCHSSDESDPAVHAFLKGGRDKCGITPADKEPSLFGEEFNDNNVTRKRSYASYPLISQGETVGALNLVYINRFNYLTPGQHRLISLISSVAASATENNTLGRNLKKSYLQTIKTLANSIEARDHYTAGHTDRVYRIARIIARRMKWDINRLARLKTGCILHDIGKIGIPDAILNKPGELTPHEWELMKKHPETGERILRDIPFLEPIIPYILFHHERYDGNGYPRGLKGEEIPIEGRLLAVIDTFDAILSDRPYRPGRDTQSALDELIANRGTQFDPIIVDIFLEAYADGYINSDIIYGRRSIEIAVLTEL
jgi:response regulator RpfG family c-di-GMP phosphodiesterase